MNDMKERKLIKMPMLALRGLVVFPKTVLYFDVGRDKSVLALNRAMSGDRKIYFVAQKDVKVDDPTAKDLYDVGVVAEIKQIVKGNTNNLRVLVEGLYRAKTVEVNSEEPFFEATIEEYPLKKQRVEKTVLCTALIRTIKNLFEEYCELAPQMPKDLIFNVMVSDDPVYIAEYICANLPLKVEDKQKVLMESNATRRLEILAKIIESENDILSLERGIQTKVKEEIDKSQREYYLREQMRLISEELGETENGQDDIEEYVQKITKLSLTQEVEEKLLKEVEKLSKMPYNSQEANVIRNYLDTCLELPWNKSTADKIDIAKAKKQLDKDHYGMQKVKERILELLAVRKLVPDMKGQIICLVGPPGVGKTSIARSIAAAMGRKYARVSLGGVRDEADIRGHRKTYIGAMPGRIINAISLAKSRNPLILLDEVDKLSNDFRGDPTSALLEVLDAEQNHAFRDHYIEVPFDLSDVLFIATANDLGNIPAPLRDRMEIIELYSYTREEKFHIGKDYLLVKQLKKHGLTARKVKIEDTAIYAIIDYYTREAGVRRLEQQIASLLRKAAKKIVAGETKRVIIDENNIEEYLGPHRFKQDYISKEDQVGVVNGLAWTSVGGEMLSVEVAVMDGSGKIETTGSLGNVMKESVLAAITYIRSCCDEWKIDKDFYKKKDLHVHFPEGAVPKDGPSAGITTCTAIVSALSGIAVRKDVAMTGEITIRGRVLPIGGLKEKTMAAYKAGIKTIIIPEDNVPDLAELDAVVTENIAFIPASNMDTVLKAALVSNVEKDDFLQTSFYQDADKRKEPQVNTISNARFPQ